jgi:N-methylhydantoinase B
MTVEADEIVVSALCDRSRIAPWGLFGGGEGQTTAFLMRREGAPAFAPFSEAAGTVSDTKFSNVRLQRGDQVLLRSPSGGGYGPPHERDPERVAEDVREGFVTAEVARRDYGVALHEDGSVDAAETARLRAGDG